MAGHRDHLRVPPHSADAEQAVLGGIMLSPAAFDRIAGKLAAEDFYRRDHQLIFRAIVDLADKGRPHDAVTLGEWFESQGMGEIVDGGAYLSHLASTTPSAANIVAYAKIVREKSILRQSIDIASSLIASAFAPGRTEAPQLLDDAIRGLMALHKAEESHEHTLANAVKTAFATAEEAYRANGRMIGVPTGFAKMDARLGGWNKSDLVLIGARPAMGKTALMVNLADAAAAAGHTVGVISGEMSALQYGQRAVSMASRVPAECMRNGQFHDEDWPKLGDAVRLMKGRKMHLYDRSAPTIEEIQRTARRWKQELGVGLLFVDYLQRIRVRGADSRADEVGEAARSLKDLARDLDIPVVCLAQVVRDVDKRPDKRPGAGDLANSDEATREADQIIMLYRDEVYHEDTNARGLAELNCEKNRHGPTGQFILRFDGPTMTFSDPDDRF